MIESRYLKADKQNLEKLYMIPGFRKFEIIQLESLLKQSKIRQYEDGEVIIKEGDKDPWLYFLLSGAVKIAKNRVAFSRIDQEGEILGEMSLIDNSVRSSSVYASGQTVCLAIDTSMSNELSSMEEKREHLLILYKIFLEYMSMRLRARTEELVALRKENKKIKDQLAEK